MHTLRLKVNDSVYDKLMWLLSKFSKEEIEIIPESAEYTKQREYLTGELNEILNGNANFIELNDVEQRLEKVIRKHETDK